MQCPSCGETVLVGARKCPSCGEPVAVKRGIAAKVVIGVLVLVVLAAGALAGVYFGKPELLPAALREAIDDALTKLTKPKKPEETPTPGAATTGAPKPGEGGQPATQPAEEGSSARDLKIPGMDALQMPEVPEIKFDTPAPPVKDEGADKIEGL